MARKRQWFLLGALGALFGVVVKLVRGRHRETTESGRWEEAQGTSDQAVS